MFLDIPAILCSVFHEKTVTDLFPSSRAGFFPAAIYLCTAWYLPSDLGVRLGALFCMAALSGAFSGLLAAGITQMDGVGGYAGWRWIFIIEGAYIYNQADLTFWTEHPQLTKEYRACNLGHRVCNFLPAGRLAVAIDSVVEFGGGEIPRITAQTEARRSQHKGY